MKSGEEVNSIITITLPWAPEKEKYLSYHKRLNKIWKLCYNILSEDGNIWIFTENKIHNAILYPISFDICENLSRVKFFIRNIIVWYVPNSEKERGRNLINRYKNILFAVKDPKNYFFDKDPIREKHIWRNVEWGKRKDHYHKLGKDPGNVWLKTRDDGKGKVISHIPLSFDEAIERCVLVGSKENDVIFNPIPNPKKLRIVVKRCGRIYKESV